MTWPGMRFLVGILLLSAIGLFAAGARSAGAVQSPASQTVILYTADSGSVPAGPLLSFAAFPGSGAMPAYRDGTTILDTTVEGAGTFAGWVSSASASDEFPVLDPIEGFHVDFAVQVESESHTNNNRAGFSVILLGEDRRGIELGFWQDAVWAQNDPATGGLFRRGESAAFDTSSRLVSYRLAVLGESYGLTADGIPILSGPLRDYTSFEGFPDPYETPNFLFIGDDTTSAQARIRLSFVSVTGTGRILPQVTATSTETNTPPPTASTTPVRTVTSIPTAASSGTGPDICAAGWIILAPLLASPIIFGGRRRSMND